MSAPITGCARQAFEANRQAQLARAESGDPSDGKVVPIDTREHGAIQHTHRHTEYREQGATRYGELQMVDSLVQQRSAVVGMSRHTHAFEMFGTIETVTSYANLVAFAQPERNKLTLDDYAVREPVESQQNKQRTWDMSPEQIDPLETTWRKAYADAALDEPRLTFAQAGIRVTMGIADCETQSMVRRAMRSTTQAAPDHADAAFNPGVCIEDGRARCPIPWTGVAAS